MLLVCKATVSSPVLCFFWPGSFNGFSRTNWELGLDHQLLHLIKNMNLQGIAPNWAVLTVFKLSCSHFAFLSQVWIWNINFSSTFTHPDLQYLPLSDSEVNTTQQTSWCFPSLLLGDSSFPLTEKSKTKPWNTKCSVKSSFYCLFFLWGLMNIWWELYKPFRGSTGSDTHWHIAQNTAPPVRVNLVMSSQLVSFHQGKQLEGNLQLNHKGSSCIMGNVDWDLNKIWVKATVSNFISVLFWAPHLASTS